MTIHRNELNPSRWLIPISIKPFVVSLKPFVVNLKSFVVSLKSFVVSLKPFVVSLSNHERFNVLI